MDTVLVAVGSRRAPKLEAVTEALQSVGAALDAAARFEVVGVAVPSGVAHTPLGRAELMAGARGRAEALVRMAAARGEAWRYFVGLEAGLEVLQENGRRMAFLENWAYVRDCAGREAYGYAGGVLLPEALAAAVIDHGTDLSVAIDAHAGAQGIRDNQGAWGVLTGDRITRRDAARMAVIHAFAPFFNVRLYGRVYGRERETRIED